MPSGKKRKRQKIATHKIKIIKTSPKITLNTGKTLKTFILQK